MANFCAECGCRLEMRECKGEEALIPFCPNCQEYRFPTFNVAVCTALFNRDRTRILLMRQYGREKYNFLAGYVNKGENAEQALLREMREEMGMSPSYVEFLYTVYYPKSNTLMVNFLTEVDDESLEGAAAGEVDEVHWFDYDTAYEAVIKGSLAERLLKHVCPLFNRS